MRGTAGSGTNFNPGYGFQFRGLYPASIGRAAHCLLSESERLVLYVKAMLWFLQASGNGPTPMPTCRPGKVVSRKRMWLPPRSNQAEFLSALLRRVLWFLDKSVSSAWLRHSPRPSPVPDQTTPSSRASFLKSNCRSRCRRQAAPSLLTWLSDFSGLSACHPGK